MGYYIQGPLKGKALHICTEHKAVPLRKTPKSVKEFPPDKAVICVVENPIFDAAAFCYDDMELGEFQTPADDRPKVWLLMDRALARELTGYKEKA